MKSDGDNNNTLVNINGHILFNSTAQTVNDCGKTLTKQEASFTDNLVGTGYKKNDIWPVLKCIKCCHKRISLIVEIFITIVIKIHCCS